MFFLHCRRLNVFGALLPYRRIGDHHVCVGRGDNIRRENNQASGLPPGKDTAFDLCAERLFIALNRSYATAKPGGALRLGEHHATALCIDLCAKPVEIADRACDLLRAVFPGAAFGFGLVLSWWEGFDLVCHAKVADRLRLVVRGSIAYQLGVNVRFIVLQRAAICAESLSSIVSSFLTITARSPRSRAVKGSRPGRLATAAT